jgi:hypothetical protein
MQAQGITQETLDALKAIRARGGNVAYKDINTGLGYQWFDLQPLVDRTFANITPLIAETPRLQGEGGNATNWKEVYAINANQLSPGVSERNRNATIVTQLRSHVAPYAELGFEDFVTWLSELEAGKLTPEVKAMAVEDLFYASRQAEEKVLLWGNTGVTSGGNGLPLGTPGTPVATLVAGGAMTAQATSVYVVALTPEGFFSSSVAGGVPALVTRTNVDGTTDTYGGGSSNRSLISNSVTTAGGNLSVSAHVAPVKGAVAYAWYVGLTSGTTAAKLAAITTINSVLLTADPAGTQAVSAIASDHSGNALIFDGLLTQTLAGNGLYATQPTGTDGTGTPLTADGFGGITEIETDLRSFWDTSRLMPDDILVSAQELSNITNKILNSGAWRFTMDGESMRGPSGGNLVRAYQGRFAMDGGKRITFTLHPNMPAGTIIYRTKQLPYRVQNMRYTFNVRTLQEWRQIDWPITRRSWDYGVYVTETAEMHASFAYGVRTNIANG